MKRAFDIIFSLCACLAMLPLLVLLAILVKATSEGPIFYSCTRIGKGNKPFQLWKLRTMFLGADRRLEELLKKDAALREEWELYRKLKNDPRITWVGKFLRKTSLDEFPQFWNVLKGDLSLVGPRPVTHEEVEKYYGKKAQKILSIRPGLTGVWVTSGRSLIAFDARVRLEESYVDQRSFFYDLKLIAKTIPALLFSKEAF